MPEISRFLGIVIKMYWNEHNPPHFHAEYGEYEVTVDINKQIISGKFPRRALNLVLEWLDLHKQELLEDWELAQNQKPLKSIKPLE
ncbi:MAG: hypothetical protein QG673_975 [Pseudomonadota bacterium]|nr:hypothetical protein [Pseudomonadota bacterium]